MHEGLTQVWTLPHSDSASLGCAVQIRHLWSEKEPKQTQVELEGAHPQEGPRSPHPP